MSRPSQSGFRRERVASLLLVALALSPAASAEIESQRLYLSGTGVADARDWEFRIDRQRRSGEGWTTLPVPSQWELHGFGAYRYGRHDGTGGEVGSYRHRFRAPADWAGRRVRLVFEGVMTDTEARLNGAPVGPVHRGGFTRFSYDVGGRLRFGEENLLEVTVSEESADASVEAAERQADYWVFGGIYRPVYLEASPPTAITHVAIDARHGGALRASVEVEVAAVVAGGAETESSDLRLTARVTTLDGLALGRALTGVVEPGELEGLEEGVVRFALEGRFPDAASWSAERPALHLLDLTLERDGAAVHRTSRRFGFRTVEVRPGEGLFVNGRRILLRGINRHSFWPDSGRTLSREINYADAALLQELNVNAVRSSHYPPDESFLEACDELGLYVIDELPGWHDAYRTEVGRGLVAELVRRDVNHPSILFWANGNEGGWNSALDGEFARHDPQGRPVLHPHDEHSGIETEHYPTYHELSALLNDETLANRLLSWLGRQRLVMPTEMLHGLYDGGLGAGLDSFWKLIRESPRALGGFLWAFLDEGVVRTDRDGALDTFGNYAPDGLVGPYREKEASFRTVRRLWSPIQIRRSDGAADRKPDFQVENRFHEIDLAECRFQWRALSLPGPWQEGLETGLLAAGEVTGPAVAPGETGRLRLELPAGVTPDAVEITAFGPRGRAVEIWSFPLVGGEPLRRRWIAAEGEEAAVTDRAVAPDESVTLEAAGRRARFDGRTGALIALESEGERLPLSGGPKLPGKGLPEIDQVRVGDAPGRRTFEVTYAEGLTSAGWTLFEDGWLRLEYQHPSRYELDGLTFELPEEWTRSIEWLGKGPDPIWRNRLAGPRLGLWRRDLDEGPPGRQARGFYAGVRWMRLVGEEGVLTIVPGSDDLYLGVSAPRFPDDARGAVAEVPPAGTLSVLHRVSLMGSKFHSGSRLYDHFPSSSPPPTRRGTVWFFWQERPAGESPGSRR